jgi:SAM-dependent methyltransferase
MTDVGFPGYTAYAHPIKSRIIDMPSPTSGIWDEIWSDHAGPDAVPDKLLITQVQGLPPGRALDIGCGEGANAVWLAARGWRVTAVDFSEVAIERGTRLAAERAVEVNFVQADASAYRPEHQYDLITSFYIQLPPGQRASMLANAARALAPGGTLLFVSHDRSSPPDGWTDEDLLTLTTHQEVASDLPGLEIERAFVFDHGPRRSHAAHSQDSDERHNSHGQPPEEADVQQESLSTVVRATRPK